MHNMVILDNINYNHYKKEGHYRRPQALGNNPKPSVEGIYRQLIDGQKVLGKSFVANVYRGLPPFGNFRRAEAFGNYRRAEAFGNYRRAKAFGNQRTWVFTEGQKPSISSREM